MALCANCHQESLRIRQDYDERNRFLREYCVLCKPEKFSDQPVTDPSDKKIYVGPEALPHMYYQGTNGVLRAKDELLQDTLSILRADPDEEARARAIAKKRKNRRTTPMTRAEIKTAERWGREVLRKRMDESLSNV
jgi:hypothetical protein